MPSSDLFTQIQGIIERLTESASEYGGVLAQVQQFLFEQFGQPGVYAAYISAAVLGLLFFWKMVKLSFAALKYLVVPAVALALVGTFFLPYSFSTLLPVTATGCSVFLLFKG